MSGIHSKNVRWTGIGRVCACTSTLKFFRSITYQTDGRVKETTAKVEELNELWQPVTKDELPMLVLNCSCIYLCLLVGCCFSSTVWLCNACAVFWETCFFDSSN